MSPRAATWAAAGLLAAASTAALGGAVAAEATGDEPLAVVTRGLTGSVEIRTGRPLLPRADLALDAPLVARIAARRPAAGAGGGDGGDGGDGAGVPRVLTIEFMGTVAGDHDLRTVLQRPDGSFPDDLAPLPVRIERRLDADAGTDVFVAARSLPRITSTYRATIVAVLVAWALVPVAVLGVRLGRRLRRPVAIPPSPPPSLAERLEPLVLAAAERSMSVEERGRLELLLIAHLGDEAGVADRPRAEAIRALRRTPDAGPLLAAVESWLHRPGPADERRHRVAGLLAPFRRRPADPPAARATGALPRTEAAP